MRDHRTCRVSRKRLLRSFFAAAAFWCLGTKAILQWTFIFAAMPPAKHAGGMFLRCSYATGKISQNNTYILVRHLRLTCIDKANKMCI